MKIKLLGLLALGLTVSACGPAPKSSWGFRLPDGDADKGQQSFVDLRCGGCHQIADSELPFDGDDEPIVLGGEVSRVQSYGELVTSIINPTHKIAADYKPESMPVSGESPMLYAGLNEVMTVQQLIDLVAFLQAQYEVTPPEVDYYPPYHL